MSVTAIIERARNGDPAAREEISNLLRERVVRTAGHYATITGMDREDLQQEMWVGTMLGLQHVDASIGDPLCYLFLRGKWRLLEAIRRSERERAESLDPATVLAERSGFEDEVCQRWLTGRLLAQLRGAQREILQGLMQGYAQQDLAHSLGCTAANVSYHVRKIRDGYRRLELD